MRASNSDLVAAITTLLCRESLALCSAFSWFAFQVAFWRWQQPHRMVFLFSFLFALADYFLKITCCKYAYSYNSIWFLSESFFLLFYFLAVRDILQNICLVGFKDRCIYIFYQTHLWSCWIIDLVISFTYMAWKGS
jgi:hypothetical protein